MKRDFPNSRKKIFSFRELSLRQQIPLLVCILLCSVVVIFGLLAYMSIKNIEIKAGKLRLLSLASQAAGMIEESLKDVIINTEEVIPEEAIRIYLKSGTPESKNTILEVLERIGGDGSSVCAELRDSSFRVLLSAGKVPDHKPAHVGLFPAATTNSLQNRAGNIYQINDSIYFPIIIPVTDNKKTVGYITRYRVVKITSKLIEQFSKLAGRGAALYVGNRDGSLWTDLIHPVPYRFPVNDFSEGKTFEYVQKDGKDKLTGAAKYVQATPWIIVLEFPAAAFLQASTQFFNWILFAGLVLVSGGIIAAWLMSRYLTRPLNALTAAATAIAAGNYVSNVTARGSDEVGKLSRSFNVMSAKLREAQDKMEQQIVEARQMNGQLRTLSAHMENVREEERLHIAREMHDELGQLLTGFKMEVYLLKRKLKGYENAEIAEKIHSLENSAGEAIQFVRRLSSELRLGPLEDLGLVAALEWYCGEFTKRYHIPVTFNSSVAGLQVSPLVRTGIFRIYQESLTNIARHAKATRVDINLSVTNDNLLLTIKDNGQGFNVNSSERRKTLGLLGMKERAIMIGATLKITSAPGEGALVEITAPLVKEQGAG